MTVIVPYAAGGPVDTIARILAARLSELLGQQIIIENVGGAGGMTGAARVAKAAPDGYTLLLSGSAVLAINQTLYKRPLYNAVTDFEQVALHSDSARVLIARKDLPANTLPEFVAYAKANQAKMQYGSAGAGSGTHVCAVLLDVAMGTKITHVPYRGAGPAMQDLIGGRIDFIAEQISTALPQIQGDKVKAIVTLGLDRAPGLENLPTADEQGLKGLDCGSWGSFSFPEGHAGRDRAAARQGDERRGRYAGRARALQAHRRDRAAARTPDARNIPTKFVPSEIERWAGTDQGERRQRRLNACPEGWRRTCANRMIVAATMAWAGACVIGRARRTGRPGRSPWWCRSRPAARSTWSARIIAPRLSELLGQQVIVENIGGRRRHERRGRVAKSPPDGYGVPVRQPGAPTPSASCSTRSRSTTRSPTSRRSAVVVEQHQGPGDAQGLAGQHASRVHRLCQGEPGEDAVRLGRRRLGHARRPACCSTPDRRQHHPRALSRHRPGDAGPHRRPHRLSCAT